MSNQLQITGGAKVRNLEGVLTGTSGVVTSLGINVPSGIPQLDGSGKILVSQLPNSVMEYKGTWNVSTNTPYLVNGVGNAGDVYIVTGAATPGGTTHDFGAGPILFYNGDQAIYDGSAWQRASGSSGSVTSVAMTTPTGLTVTGSPITTSGTLALSLSSGYTIPTTSFLSGLVPYTGATQTVDLGSYDLNARGIKINGTGGSGHADFKHQSGTPTGSASSSTLYADTDGDLAWLNDHSYTTTFIGSSHTANRNYTLPDASGTLALTSDIPSLSGYVTLATAQTITGIKTFSNEALFGNNITLTGGDIVIKNGSYNVNLNTVPALTANRAINFPDKSGIVALTSDISYPVTSVFGRTGAVVAASGDYTTSLVTEGTNLYYTDARARAAFSETVTGLDYNSTTGVLSTTTGYGIPTTAKQTTWDTAYNDSIVSASVTGTTTKTLTLTQQDGGTVTASWTDYDTAPVTSVFGRTGAVTAQSGDYTTTLVTEGTNLYFTNARARGAISLTTTGTSGAATYNSTTGVLNIPNYSETTFGTVTSVGLSSATSGVTIGSSPITTSGTITLAIATASGTQQGLLSSTDWTTFNSKQGAITLTTTGTSGVATLVGNTLNIPQYQSALTNPVTGTGTTNTLPKFTGTSAIGNSNITDDGSLVTLGSNSYVNGALGIGTSTLTGYNLRVSKNLTGGVQSYSVKNDAAVQSDVTTAAHGFHNESNTAASAFTLANYRHFFAFQGTFGAGSSVTSQFGFAVDSTLTGATNNYGFRGAIGAGANRWNIYMDGTANNYMAGSLGIGSTSIINNNLKISKNITGGTTAISLYQDAQIQSDVTLSARYFDSYAQIQNTAFTLTGLYHYSAGANSFGSATVTNQYGFRVGSTLNGATNNYGFYGELAAASNTWNLFMVGAANNYMAGSLGIGSTSLTGYGLRNSKNITGATLSIAYSADGSVQSDVTTTAQGYRSVIATQATAFTLTNLQHFVAGQGTFGAGSTVTNQYAFYADSGLISATNNYGFYSAMTLSGTSRWALYMAGTAPNYIASNLFIGTTTDAGYKLDVNGTGRFSGDLTLSGASGNRTLNIQTNTSGDAILALTAAGSDGGTITYKRSTSEMIFGNSSASSALKIASTGAATFSSSVTAASDFINGTIADNGTGRFRGSFNSVNTSSSLAKVQFGGGEGSQFRAYMEVRQVWNGSGTDQDLGFTSFKGGVGSAEAMTIKGNGNVGIGTSSPNGLLHVNGSSLIGSGTVTNGTTYGGGGQVNRLKVESGNYTCLEINGSTSGGSIQFTYGTNLPNQVGGLIGYNYASGTVNGFDIANMLNGPMVFSTNATEKMRITSGGNVLIGSTTDNGNKLQVSGITQTTGLSLSGTSVSTSQNITSSYYMWVFNGGSGQTLTLYSTSGHNNTHFIKNSSANSLTLAVTSGYYIETLTSTTTVTSITIAAYKTVQVISNGGYVWIIMNAS